VPTEEWTTKITIFADGDDAGSSFWGGYKGWRYWI